MGVNLAPLLIDVRHEKELKDFARKRIAFDAFNTIYQFLASIRQMDGQPLEDLNGHVTSHLSGLFYRNLRLMREGVKPVYVFDGKRPKFKEKTVEKRIKEKEEAQVLYEKAAAEEDTKAMKKYAQASLHLTKEMVEESKELLRALGIAVVQAPSEGEAQAAYMAAKKVVDASASQDYDSLLFGSPKLIRNLSITGRRKIASRDEWKTIKPEELVLKEVLKKLEITREQLIIMGLLVGTDFDRGVKGVGPKTALKIVKQYPTLDAVGKYIKEKYDVEFEPYIKEVYDFFLHPPAIDVELKDIKLDEERVKKILVDEHDFGEERVEHGLRELKEALEKERQTTLTKWF